MNEKYTYEMKYEIAKFTIFRSYDSDVKKSHGCSKSYDKNLKRKSLVFLYEKDGK